MTNKELLIDLTESYLKSIIYEVSSSIDANFDSNTPFGELGVDSFRVLKIIKILEADFGVLPKTLLFENFNVNDLVNYFIEHHNMTLVNKFSDKFQNNTASTHFTDNNSKSLVIDSVTKIKSKQSNYITIQATPTLILEEDAYKDSELGNVIKNLFNQYKNEGSVSRGTRNIAPNLFIGSEKKGYFNYGRSKNIILAYAYTGPEDYYLTLANEIHRHCIDHNFELNILSGHEIKYICETPVTSTPFGVIQRVLDIQNFTLNGQKMRRLRYLVSKFKKSGNCRIEEHICGSNKVVAENIANIIDQWCAEKSMVNPLIHIVKDEILSGTLDIEHRIFVTYVNDIMQNVILISPLSSEQNGYLMDLEFYSKDMHLGGLEFAIVKIIEILVAEKCNILSLGGTYGCKFENSSNADPEVDKILDDLRMQNIFNDEGNLQFKNKFRPENKTIFLCRPKEKCNPDNVIDIIMMIADPSKMQTSDKENQEALKSINQSTEPVHIKFKLNNEKTFNQKNITEASDIGGKPSLVIDGDIRSLNLSKFEFNPLRIPYDQIEYDLKSDSWAQLNMSVINSQIEHLHAYIQKPVSLVKNLRGIFPFKYFILTNSGRTAESIFYNAWQNKGNVLQNLLFPTTIYNQIDKGFSPVEIPNPAIFQLDLVELYKGNLNLSSLQKQIEQDSKAIAFVCIEINNNAAGGYPVSINHLRKVKELLSINSIPLVIDGTRILENARFLIENEAEYFDKSVWHVANEIFSYADAVHASLTKDFCLTKGGLIAINNEQLFKKLQNLVNEEGCGLNSIEKKLVALSLDDRQFIESKSRSRMEHVKRIWSVLREHGVPVVQPSGGHCILIDVKQLTEFKGFKYPVASFLAWLYLNTGIRAGAHNVGIQKDTAINDLIRLAIPVGLKEQEVDDIIDKLVSNFTCKINIPELMLAENKIVNIEDVLQSKYKLIKYHNQSGSLIPKSVFSTDITTKNCTDVNGVENDITKSQKIFRTQASSKSDVAIVGMSGRYPKAKNIQEMWENLINGIDCIETISEARLSQRLSNSFTEKYRGGFIDDVDKFDAEFFSITEKEAEILDPQERLFLEVAYEAVEDAGYYPEILGGEDCSSNIGVYVGAVWSMYQMYGVEEKMAGNNINPSSFFWSIANRVSYWMNLTGPSLTLDTACSASLTAINLACESIYRGECTAAIVGGVNLDLHQSKFDINSTGGAVSKNGVCRSFGKDANGYVSGEGVGALFLKPLDQAVADDDNIYAVIKNSVVSHSGKTGGYTIPNPHSQSQLVLKALENSNIDARSIGYIEAHGTGTDFGDSIEISGLSKTFQKFGVANQSCSIGSAKTNFGHLEAASGILGVQKVILQMMNKKLVPSLHSSELNENINFKNSPFYVQQNVEEWKTKEVDGVVFPRRAGINAFGAGGTNAHIILEEFELADHFSENNEIEPLEKIFPLSARTEEQLRNMAVHLNNFILNSSIQNLLPVKLLENDIAHTLQVGRKSFEYRLVIIAKTKEELVEKLTSFIKGEKSNDIMTGHLNNSKKITDFLNKKEKKEFINVLLKSNEPHRISQLWCDGVIANWRELNIVQKGKKIPIPTYPFADKRYWISNRKSSNFESKTSPVLMPSDKGPYQFEGMLNGTAIKNGERSTKKFPSTIKTTENYRASFHNDNKKSNESSLSVESKARIFVQHMLANKLQISIGDISEDCNLMSIGITSIDMAEMTQTIKDRLDPDFSPVAFFECTTVRSFSKLLAQNYGTVFDKMAIMSPVTKAGKLLVETEEKVETQEVKINVPKNQIHVQDAEIELPLNNLEENLAVYNGTIRQVLITGSNGFLGVHMLHEFLSLNSNIKVYCLVRAKNKEHGLQRILKQAKRFELNIDESRIFVLCGDISKTRLGLSKKDWDICCRTIQQIVHASAHVNHIEGYSTFRDSTRGMKEVIRLACSHNLKLIQFISSIAGCALKIGEEFSIFDKEEFITDGENVYGGYGQSKWVQETYLKRAHENGVPFVIYRFGELSGSSQTGLGQVDDMLHRLLQMRLAIECKEKISSDVLDMLPVDFAAKLIVNTGKTPELWNSIVHATHLKPYTFAKLYRKAQDIGMQFKPVTRTEYLLKCYDYIKFIYTVNPVDGFVLESVLRDAEGSIRNRKMMDSYFSVIFPFDQDNFKKSLNKLELALPEWNSLIDRYLERWSKDGHDFIVKIQEYRKWSCLNDAQKTVLASKKLVAIKDNSMQHCNGRPLELKNNQDPAILENVSEV